MSSTFSSSFLRGKTAVVTGSSAGIGAACARALAANGATVIGWERTVRSDAPHEVIIGDLSDLARTQELAAEIADARKIDILVNNAGIISRGPATGITLDDWRAVMTVNLDATFALAQAFGRSMVERGEGSVINVASLLSFQGGINVASYTASKHAVAGLTKALCNEWAGSGVTVNAVAPGYVVTDNTEALRADAVRMEQISSRIPAGRWAAPDDIAGPVVFLSSPAAEYVNGHVLVVDGGWMGR